MPAGTKLCDNQLPARVLIKKQEIIVKRCRRIQQTKMILAVTNQILLQGKLNMLYVVCWRLCLY